MSLRDLSPRQRIAAIADPGTVSSIGKSFDVPRPSPHLARWNIAPQDDDGIVVARVAVHGASVLVAAQDERFLGGSAGANHAAVLRAAFEHAQVEKPAAIVLLAASGGVRLYEANPAELALAHALSAMLDVRAAGIPVLALGVADVFGGASVLFCAAERASMLAGTRLGLSGPRVLEVASDAEAFDATDGEAVAALFGAEARSRAGHAELLADDADTVRAWIDLATRGSVPFAAHVGAMQQRLATRIADQPVASSFNRLPAFANADPVDSNGSLWRVRGERVWLARPLGRASMGPEETHALDAALISEFASRAITEGETLVVVEDSAGHAVSRRAEQALVSSFLGHHAAVLALLRSRGVCLVGLLVGTGHSAAFFANALQCKAVVALEAARVVAMEPGAIARVTHLHPAQVAALVENDPVFGQPIRCFAAWGGIADIRGTVDSDAVLEIVNRFRKTSHQQGEP